MKSTLALTLFATLAIQQVVLAQEDGEVNIATAPPAAVETPNIYWWTTLLNSDDLKNYLLPTQNDVATPTANVDATTTAAETAATTAAETSAAETSAATTAAETASAAVTTASEEILSIQTAPASSASAESSLASAVSEVSSAASSVPAYSTPSAVPWSSTVASASSGFIAPTNSLPRPSGSIIPPVTTSGSIQPSNSGSLLVADLGKILFSVTVGAFLGNFLN